MKALTRWTITGLLAFALVGALASAGLAASVTPEFVAGSSNHTCGAFAGDGQTWTETKVDPPANGTVTTSAGSITISNLTTTSFDWTATFGVDAVFVKSGSEGSNLYRYDPPAESTGDSGLESPSKQQISHISFCWDAEAPPSPSPSPETVVLPRRVVKNPVVKPAGTPEVLGARLAATGASKPALALTGLTLFALGAAMVYTGRRLSSAGSTRR